MRKGSKSGAPAEIGRYHMYVFGSNEDSNTLILDDPSCVNVGNLDLEYFLLFRFSEVPVFSHPSGIC